MPDPPRNAASFKHWTRDEVQTLQDSTRHVPSSELRRILLYLCGLHVILDAVSYIHTKQQVILQFLFIFPGGIHVGKLLYSELQTLFAKFSPPSTLMKMCPFYFLLLFLSLFYVFVYFVRSYRRATISDTTPRTAGYATNIPSYSSKIRTPSDSDCSIVRITTSNGTEWRHRTKLTCK